MELKDRFAKALEYFRKSQKDFYEYGGFKPQYVSGMIRGDNSIGLKPINKLLEFIPELNANWLLKGEGSISVFEYKENVVNEDQAQYSNIKLSNLQTQLEECRKDKERAWGMVSWLQEQVDELKKKEAS